MADIVVRAPDGAIVEVPEDQYQRALDQGYQNVSQEEANAARQQYIESVGREEAVRQGVLEAKPGYSVGVAAAEKALSAATFGQFPGLDRPEAIAVGKRFSAEHPYAAFGAEVVGQLPGAVALEVATAGAAPLLAGAGWAARAGFRAGEFGAQAALGGAQTEGEAARLEQREFNPTNAAVVGVFGETFGRGAAWGFSKGLGFSRNAIAKGIQRAVEQDAGDSLQRGGLLSDFRVAAHAETYQKELSKLAADDLDTLETAFNEVSRQDRKRLRVARVVEELPEQQHAVRMELLGSYQKLYDALFAEVGEGAPAPARRLLDQLRGRMDVLAQDAPVGKKLWRQLDENRQALQEYSGDLHRAYENAPGSAWLSHDGLRALDDVTRQTREALLREDAWGATAAREQAAYNVPFNEKFFPNDRTVRGKLFFEAGESAHGRPVFRGDPGKLLRLFQRGADDVDSSRLVEQFRDWLDGVEAVSRAGERDTPAAASRALESVRRLRKALSHAEFVAQASERFAGRAELAEVGLGAGAGVLAGASGGGLLVGGLAGKAVHGLRLSNWLFRAAKKIGWAVRSPESMAELLGRGALPARQGPDVPVRLTDDLLESPPPGPRPPEPPPGGPGAPPAAPAAPAGPGVPPAPAAPPGGAQAAADAADELRRQAGEAAMREARARWGANAKGDAFFDTRNQQIAIRQMADSAGTAGVWVDSIKAQLGPDAEVALRQMAEDGNIEIRGDRVYASSAAGPATLPSRDVGALIEDTLTQQEFRDVVQRLKASGSDEARSLADALEQQEADLVDEGWVSTAEYPPHLEATGPATQPSQAATETLDIVRSGGRHGVAAGLLEPAALRELVNADKVRRIGERVYARGSFSAYTPATPAAPAATLSPAAQTAQQAFTDLGIEVRMGGQRLQDTLENVFKDRPPTAEEWRGIIPLETLRELGPVEKARVDVLGDSFIWSAEGQTGMTGPHRLWDGREAPGGYQDNAWKISRTFSRDDAGQLEVHHDHFFVRGDLQGSGVGAKVLRDMMSTYRKIGVDVVSVDSVEIGRYFWPSVGFNHPDPDVVRHAVERYKRWLQGDAGRELGLTPDQLRQAQADADRVKSIPSLAQAEFGKQFLLEVPGNWNFGLQLKLNDSDPFYHLMRGRLDIAAAGLAALGAGALEGGPDDASQDQPGQPAAAAGAPVAGFAATTALFSRARGRLVTNVARQLFSGLAEPTVKTVARLAYSHAQLKARREEIQGWTQDPNALVERVAEGFRDAPPDVFAATSAAAFRAASFLRDRLPQSGAPSPVAARGAAPPVPADAASKYARYEQAALEPGEALREAAQSGYLSSELLETLEELYPDLLAELRVAAYQTVQEGAGAGSVSIQAKTQYARLFDGDGSLASPAFSPTATKAYAYSYEQQAQVQAAAPPAGPRPGVSQVAASLAPPRPWQTG
jgi:hypothetical protein